MLRVRKETDVFLDPIFHRVKAHRVQKKTKVPPPDLKIDHVHLGGAAQAISGQPESKHTRSHDSGDVFEGLVCCRRDVATQNHKLTDVDHPAHYHCITLHDITVQYSTVRYSTVQHSTAQHNTVQYSTLHCVALHCIALMCIEFVLA